MTDISYFLALLFSQNNVSSASENDGNSIDILSASEESEVL